MQSSAFQIEPGRRPYPLRLSKYQAIGESVGRFAALRPTPNGGKGKLSIADIGGDEGRIYRYIEAFLPEDRFDATIIDLFPKGTKRVYKKDRRTLIQADLELGLPMVDSHSFDVIICEQVMEHLQNPGQLATELNRALKPGGLCIMGVPTFPAGFRWVRSNVIPRLDRLRGRNRSHVQAFSVNSFLQMIRRSASWELMEVRGFRIVSGGLLRNLECYRWWWRLNRWLGRRFPSLCIEAQVLATTTELVAPRAPLSDPRSIASRVGPSAAPHPHA